MYRLEANAHLLQPPINNYCVSDGDVTVMVARRFPSIAFLELNQLLLFFYQACATDYFHH